MSFKNINIPLSFVGVLLLRILFKGATIGDSIALSALCSLYGYTKYLTFKVEIPINDSLKIDIENLKNAVGSLKIAKSMGRI